ncbi:MAG: hypothetical protein AAB724_02475 [Patescibacteria group bacterium]
MKKKELRSRNVFVRLYLYREAGWKKSKVFPAVGNNGKKLIFGPSEDGESLNHLEDRLLGTTYRIEFWFGGGLADYCKVLPCGCQVYRDQTKHRTRKIRTPERRRLRNKYLSGDTNKR